ncbi:MAG: RnfABCDGE type electron transport complex subunit D [Clostridia bacterium]|nr:RnfABCDGE type electron transport complex subunit D [Clostridia bacterium]
MDNQNTKFLTMTASPHVKSPVKTKNLMADVIIALMPALVWAIFVFGFRALTVTAVSVLSCVLFEYLYRKLMKKTNTVSDLSAVVTGILLAYSLPVSVPLWLPVIGSFFAIVIVKQLYGGIGKNIINPALAARVFLFIAYPTELTAFTAPGEHLSPFAINVSKAASDVAAGATPLVNMKNGIMPDADITATLIGNIPGTIGEVSATLLILTGLYLMIKKVITWHIPVTYIATVAIITLIFPLGDFSGVSSMLLHLFSGGLMLGAFFMATDYVTSPATNLGRIIYGVGCGLITVFIRYFGGYPEGVSFAILIMNLFVWYLDKATKPRVFGGAKK